VKEIILDKKYFLGMGLGSWAKSFENGVKKGDVRLIGGKLMYAYTVYFNKWSANEVNWCPVEKSEFSDLRAWIKEL
jgi:hypothetical protein